jgi:hypothetical protein
MIEELRSEFLSNTQAFKGRKVRAFKPFVGRMSERLESVTIEFEDGGKLTLRVGHDEIVVDNERTTR